MAAPKKTPRKASITDDLLAGRQVAKRAFGPSKKSSSSKPHPGQPDARARKDRAGSQLERERHQHPSSTIPNAGAARSNKQLVKKTRNAGKK
ncbi:MAG TPA: hypothetical protein PKY96_00575 [Flavobacteriales bacterium]|nr:hypothetical protein [Flavobacteriales bacterium]